MREGEEWHGEALQRRAPEDMLAGRQEVAAQGRETQREIASENSRPLALRGPMMRGL